MSRLRIELDTKSFQNLWPMLSPAFGSKTAFVQAALDKTLADLMDNPVVVYDILARMASEDGNHLLAGFAGYLMLTDQPAMSIEDLTASVDGALAAAGVTPFAFRQWLAGTSDGSRETLARHWVQYCSQRDTDSRTVWLSKPSFSWPADFSAFWCSEKTLHTLLSPSARHWRYNESFPI